MHTQRWFLPAAACSILFLIVPVGLRMAGGDAQAAQAAQAAVSLAASGETLAQYDRATDLVAAGRDDEAIRLLAQARLRPLAVTGRSAPEPAPGDISASGLVIRLGSALCNRALAHAKAGRRDASRRCVLQARRLANHVLETRVPSLDALQAARAIDIKADRTERAIARTTGGGQDLARIARREEALGAFYNRQVMCEVMAARDRRTAAMHQVLTQVSGGGERAQAIRKLDRVMDREDADLAAFLLRRYAAERSRLIS